MEDRQSFQDRIEARFNELAGKLGRGVHRVEAEARRQAGDLPQHFEHFEEKMREFKDAGDDKWQELRPELERSWHELRQFAEKAFARKDKSDRGSSE